MLNTPVIALDLVRKEIANMLKEAFTNYKLGYKEVISQDFDSSKEIEDLREYVDTQDNAVYNSIQSIEDFKIASCIFLSFAISFFFNSCFLFTSS